MLTQRLQFWGSWTVAVITLNRDAECQLRLGGASASHRKPVGRNVQRKRLARLPRSAPCQHQPGGKLQRHSGRGGRRRRRERRGGADSHRGLPAVQPSSTINVVQYWTNQQASAAPEALQMRCSRPPLLAKVADNSAG